MKMLEKTTETNDQGYAVINARALQPHTDHILVHWELNQDYFKAGNVILARPDTHKKVHYTGNVIAVGPDVDPAIKTGSRIAFDQFSDPDKYFDEYFGRVALLKEERQGQLFMLISERTKFEGGEPTYNFDA